MCLEYNLAAVSLWSSCFLISGHLWLFLHFFCKICCLRIFSCKTWYDMREGCLAPHARFEAGLTCVSIFCNPLYLEATLGYVVFRQNRAQNYCSSGLPAWVGTYPRGSRNSGHILLCFEVINQNTAVYLLCNTPASSLHSPLFSQSRARLTIFANVTRHIVDCLFLGK